MIRTNLSTKPFYNERSVQTLLLIVAVLVVAATSFNVSRVVGYSRSDTRLATQASRDEARAADLRQQAVRLRASVDPKQVDFASADARQANDLIDRRTFSWTELFNQFEMTLPDEVRITSVRPHTDRTHNTVLTIMVVARGVDDVSAFMANLEATGSFTNLRPAEEHMNERGELESMLEMAYTPPSAKPPAADAAPAKAGRP
jgi:Tfp pilus assembly protein PilN